MSLPVLTPAFVYDERVLRGTGERLRRLTDEAGCNPLYSPKACAIPGLLRILSESVEGFSCSSLNECRRTGEISRPGDLIHLVTPGIREEDLDQISVLCDYVVLNSLSQLDRMSFELSKNVKLGLRVNPQLSFAKDERYDPCRRNSKLGVPISSLRPPRPESLEAIGRIDGIHVHNNCEGTDARQLAKTVETLVANVPHLLEQVQWINLGGGYLMDELEHRDVFVETVAGLKSNYSLEVFIEPGAAVVRSAGSIVATVIDLFESGDKTVAILDTTVNHMPEVLEYQFTPDVVGHSEGGRFQYLLAGCTCLAGDQFGTSNFDAPLSIGSQVIFPNAGAYTIARANTFNGVDLPRIYRRTMDGTLVEEEQRSVEAVESSDEHQSTEYA